MSAVPATIPATRQSLVAKFAGRYSIEPEKLLSVLKATAFKQGANDPEVSNEQMAALLVVADQYGLNPFTKEIYAFADKHKGVVPVVGIDGWSRIINEKDELDGIEFRYSADGEPEWIECVIYRKDRARPTVVREYLAECKRETGPWKSHTRRMLRHKALIQCARVAFGFAGIYDDDEAARIVERDITPAPDPERSGTARLKAAVTASAGVAASAPAPSDPEPSAANESSTAERGKEKGTLELMEKFLAAFAASTDAEILALKRDEVRMYEWAEADLQELTAAGQARADLLARDLAGHISHVGTLGSLEEISAYSDALPEATRADERYTKAVSARLKALNQKKK